MASAELQIPEHIQETQNITREELEMILHTQNPLVTEELRRRAQQTAKAIYGNKIYVRGLIEFTNYCKNNCYYCGIRCSNTDADRYRLSLEQILSCCETGWNLGFRTFVLQGGEDPHFTDEHICQIVRTIKEIYPDCAVTLSIGEKSEESYQAYFNAGAGFQKKLSEKPEENRISNRMWIHGRISGTNCRYTLPRFFIY